MTQARAKEDLGTAEKFVDSRSCWVGGLPRRVAKEKALAALLEQARATPSRKYMSLCMYGVSCREEVVCVMD